MYNKILRVILGLLAFFAAGLWAFLNPSLTYADGPSQLVVVNGTRPQWDESPVRVCVQDDAGQLMPGVVVTATFTSLQPNTQVLTAGADGCVSLPVKGFLSTTADSTNLGEVVVKENPSVRIEVVVTVTGPKPDVTGWVAGQMDVYWTSYVTYDPKVVLRWWGKNATVFVQVAHPAVIQSGFADQQRYYWAQGTPIPAGTSVKVFGMTGDAKWVDITVQMPGWPQDHFFFPSGDLSESWPFPPEKAEKADATGYIPGTPANWVDGKNPGIAGENRQGRREFFIRTKTPEIAEGNFLAQRRVYGRELSVNEVVTVNYVTPDNAWANITHAGSGSRFFIPTKSLSVVWQAPVKGQTQMNYRVTRGDTLSGIARHFGVTVDSLVTANGIANPNLIIVGQVLVVPNPTAP